MDDIVFDKRPGSNSDYAKASAYLAIKWAQAAIIKMWQFPPKLRGKEVVLQPDSAPAATSLSLMDYMGKTQGTMGEGGRGFLSFLTRVHLLAGFSQGAIGRLYRKMLRRQVG
jgi:hypothetical protein